MRSSLAEAVAGPLAVRSLDGASGHRVLVLDGGLSSELERRGHDISGRLWSAQLLDQAPEAIRAAHSDFLAAGAQVITTASYQASTAGLARAGVDPAAARRLLRTSVLLAQQAREATPGSGPRWVAGSVGPYGAMLADGSEYSGAYAGPSGISVGELQEFHRPRLQLLAEAGVDVLAAETVPCVREAEALVRELAALELPSWLSLTTVLGPGGAVLTRRGEPAQEAFALVRGVESIIAVGVNCTRPEGLEAAIAVAAEASGKPVIAYPNSGEGWDAAARSWTGTASAAFDPIDVGRWVAAGARMVGGCCRVGPEQIAQLAEAFGRGF